MPRAQVPGPVGLDFRWHAFDRGTLALAPNPPPGPVGLSFVSHTASASPEATATSSASATEESAPVGSGIDVEAAVAKIEAIALPNYQGRCARHVRIALEAGGADLSTRPTYAKDYGPKLLQLGLRVVDQAGYTPQKGDVVVFQAYASQSPQAGHIQMYSGSQWISDTRQPRFLAHSVHYVGIPYVIYRP